MSAQTKTAIRFETAITTIENSKVMMLPAEASRKLPSRGQVAVTGTVNGRPFRTVVEPDGRSGHWIKVDARMQRAGGLRAGETAEFEIQPAKEWPEPPVPADLQKALAEAPKKIREIWADITPMARWEWVRWVNETRNADTRRRRVEVTISKIDHGKRRPCCFNLAACTDPDVARSGKLPV